MRNRSINSTRLISPPSSSEKSSLMRARLSLPFLSVVTSNGRRLIRARREGMDIDDDYQLRIGACISPPLSPLEDYAAAQRYRVWIRVISVN